MQEHVHFVRVREHVRSVDQSSTPSWQCHDCLGAAVTQPLHCVQSQWHHIHSPTACPHPPSILPPRRRTQDALHQCSQSLNLTSCGHSQQCLQSLNLSSGWHSLQCLQGPI